MQHQITVTGSVVSAGRCVVLSTPAGRWAVVGRIQPAAKQGERLTVRGRPAAVPRGCDAAKGISAASVRRP